MDGDSRQAMRLSVKGGAGRQAVASPVDSRSSAAGARLSADVRFPQAIRTLMVWLLVLGVGVELLYARYDWGPEGGRFAERGFALSAYLFVIVLPTTYYLARYVLHNTLVAAGLTAFLFVATTLPYELLGLDEIYYYRVRPQFYKSDQFPPSLEWLPGTTIDFPPSLEFLPGGTLRAFPFDWLFMPLLFATGVTAIWGVWWLRKRAGLTATRRIPALLTVVFALICVQSFLHSSMRAPYTYLAYFQRPEAEQHWYHVYHFSDGSGATEGDQWVYSPLEDYFQGAPRDGSNMLIRRPFSFYLASQASYFVNTFYVWLALNCLFWLAAVVATGRLVAQLTTERAGLIAGALTAVGPGFIAFVATPAMYMQNYAAVAVALCLFQDLVVRPAGRDLGKIAVFTGALTLCALVYDLTPLLLVLLAYGLASGVRGWPLLVSLAATFIATRGFPLVVTDVLGITIDPTNQEQVSQALDRTKDFLLNPGAEWYDATVTIVPSYLRQLMQAFFVLPLLVAVFGLRKLHDRPLQVLVGGLFAMGFVTIAVLQIGGQPIGRLPRLVYPVFPAVYLLAALALDSMKPLGRPTGDSLTVRALDTARVVAPWAVVGAMVVAANVDIFGYPRSYVEYFVNDPPAFLPR
jgi:hypothetical protein